jgi:hypothetical protein
MKRGRGYLSSGSALEAQVTRQRRGAVWCMMVAMVAVAAVAVLVRTTSDKGSSEGT